MGYIVLAMLFLLSGVLLVAGGTKLLDRDSFSSSLARMGFPKDAISIVSIVVPFGEVVLGMALLVPSTAQWSAAITACLMMIYAVFVGWKIQTHQDVECACFGNLASASMNGRTVVRNAVLMLLAVIVFVGNQTGKMPTVGAAWRTIEESRWLVATLALLSLAISIVVLILAVYLLVQYGAISLALNPTQNGSGVKRGDPSPEFALVDAAERSVSRDELILAASTMLSIVFVSSNCIHCDLLFERLSEDQSPDATTLVIAAIGGADEVRRRLGTESKFYSRVFEDVGAAVAKSLGVISTPTIVQLGRDGRIASDMETGADRVIATLGLSGG